MNTTPEIQEQIKAARALFNAIERGDQIEWNSDGRDKPKWNDVPVEIVLDVLSRYRAKPKPIPYTVYELLEHGIHYVLSGGDVWTVRSMNMVRNSLTILHKGNPIERQPEWFAYRNFLWSADGKNWNQFRRAKQ